jgi:hypothetical protein
MLGYFCGYLLGFSRGYNERIKDQRYEMARLSAEPSDEDDEEERGDSCWLHHVSCD